MSFSARAADGDGPADRDRADRDRADALPADHEGACDTPLEVEGVRTRVQKSLDDFLSRRAAVLDDVSPDLAPLTDAATELLSGGKRLRAAFCYWGWRGAGGTDGPGIIDAASALELFQAAALVHDDVMDDSDTRRGLPSAHRRFAAIHRGNGYVGPPHRFGQAGAILLGNLLLCWSDELLAGSGLSAAELARGRNVFDVMRTQLMGGQYLDMLEQVLPAEQGGGSVERARTVIHYKSAKYSIEHPLLLGGSLGDAPIEMLAGYSAYGLPLGEAFQLRDDVLGVFGDPAETGKPAGDDLREGKRTVLVATALASASPAQAAAVRRHLGDPHLDAQGVALLREVLVSTGALAAVERSIEALSAEAECALDGLDLDGGAAPVLRGLIAAATARTV